MNGPMLAALIIVASGQGGEAPAQSALQKCEAAARSVYGQTAVQPAAQAPKKLKHVQPSFPSDDRARQGSGRWLGTALIGTDGKVKDVWVIKEPTFRPAWPEWSSTIPGAIKHWEYAPTVVGGQAQPVCMAVSVDIHWTAK